MTHQERREYKTTLDHWRRLIAELGINRVEECYRDALFMVVPRHRLMALRNAIDAEYASRC